MIRFLLLSLVVISISVPGRCDEPVPEGDFPGEVRLLLPPSIPMLSGLEGNSYFDSAFLALNPANYLVDLTCAKGAQQVERWTWAPKAEEAGTHAFKIEIRDANNRVVARASSTLQAKARAVSAVPAKPLSLLIIGDSLTAASIYSQSPISRRRMPCLVLSPAPGAPGRSRVECHSAPR